MHISDRPCCFVSDIFLSHRRPTIAVSSESVNTRRTKYPRVAGGAMAMRRTSIGTPQSLARWKLLCIWVCIISTLNGDEEASGSEEHAAGGSHQVESSPAVSLSVQRHHVKLDNGILQLTLSNPGGIITGLRYQGVDNLMETHNEEFNRGYWDLVWSEPSDPKITFDRIQGTNFMVTLHNDDQLEVSFKRTWNRSLKADTKQVPLAIDRRFVMLRGHSGFYTYAIFEHLKGWPDFDMPETRVTIKLSRERFHYMAISDDRQRIMPMPQDCLPPRGYPLDFKEAVQLVNPINPDLRGEVDCKYQYSCENKDNKVHGWICFNPPIGFWQISPSDEFRTGGPIKQSLTSHVGPTNLAVFVSDHYAGTDLVPKFRNGEYWKKVFGPIFFYLNTSPRDGNALNLWEDAKSQMKIEVESWPYTFPASVDFPKAKQRGSIVGRLMVRDRYLKEEYMPTIVAYVGLALPGEAGSWQRECKGYQFWTKANTKGFFSINKIRVGEYNLYAWVPGFIGDYKYAEKITITEGSYTDLGKLVFEPPRDGPTLWEIGIPDRSAAEFYIPNPDPMYINKLYINHSDRFRQYGLWKKYAELYPKNDLVYKVGTSNYTKDWFFVQVNRKMGDSFKAYRATTWQIRFKLDHLIQGSSYKLRIALASARQSELEVRINDPMASTPHFSTGVIGGESTIARHGIHGLYWLFSIDVPSSWLVGGENVIYLTQAKNKSAFQGIMYDYIRLEALVASNSNKK